MSLLRQVAKFAFAATDFLLPSPTGPRILIYHQVGSGSGKQMEVSSADFQWQLDWLAANREVVDLETAIRRWDEPGADRLVVLTFDDGYEDTYTTAFPLLRDRELPFTLYMTTRYVDGHGNDGAGTLKWDHISEMVESGLLTVGAHTDSHVDLRRVDKSKIEYEIRQSNELIEANLKVTPLHFAYPWGYWSEGAHEIVSTTYKSAVLGAPPGRRPFDAHRLHRYPIQLSDGRYWLRSRLRGGLVLEERLRRRLRGYVGP